jgi:hypothetical protein
MMMVGVLDRRVPRSRPEGAAREPRRDDEPLHVCLDLVQAVALKRNPALRTSSAGSTRIAPIPPSARERAALAYVGASRDHHVDEAISSPPHFDEREIVEITWRTRHKMPTRSTSG